VTGDPQIVDPPGQGGLLLRLAQSGRLVVHTDRRLAAVDASSAQIVRAGAIESLFAETIGGVSAVVLAESRRSRRQLEWVSRGSHLAQAVHSAGDCREPRSALEAIYDGAVVGRRI
jgi:hypothetical protein